MTALRVGVIGLGVMGRNHARILSEIDEAALVAVCDSSAQAASWAKKKFRATAYTSYAEMLQREDLDAITVAVPTGSHRDVGLMALDRGLHVLIEKPIASDLGEAQQLIAAARHRQRVLAVGHVERFNPAIRELKRRLELRQLGRVFQVHARRLGPFPPRIRDVGVVIDLATHDLDIMRYLLDAEVVRVYAETQRRLHTEHEDMLSALLKFDDGTVGMLDVNWVTPTKVRVISVVGERGMLQVDYLDQALTFFENDFAVGDWSGSAALPGVGEGNVVRYRVERGEPLRLELVSFLRAAARGGAPEVGGEDGVRALHLALQLMEAGRASQVIGLIPASENLTVVKRP